MATISHLRIRFTTDASGNATATAGKRIVGLLYEVELAGASLAAGADITLSVTEALGGNNRTLLTLTNAGGAHAFYYPVANTCSQTGVASTQEAQMVVEGKPTVTVAQGGNAVAGEIILRYFEER